MVSVQGRRRALVLIASGIDTFSKDQHGQQRKIARTPAFLLHNRRGNLFFKI